ncbi:MAG: TonB family protein, partial [Pedobacter sp.]
AVKPLSALKSSVDKAAEQSLEVNTDWEDFYTHMKKSVRYPAMAQEANIQGYTQTLFTVKNGKVEDVTSGPSKLGAGTDEEIKRCIKSYTNYSTIPDGKYSTTVAFTLSGTGIDQNDLKNKDLRPVEGYTPLSSEIVIRGYKGAPGMSGRVNNDGVPAQGAAEPLSEVVVVGHGDINQSNDKVYDFVSLDRQPTFPGGMDKYYEYLQTNLRYPSEARANKVQGKVFLSFIVETDGEISNIRIDRRLGAGTDEEAVRVIAESPKWVPGIKDGKEVRVKFNIPISFTLGVSGAATTQGNIQYRVASQPPVQAGQENDKVYDFVSLEKQPEFVGGMKKFYEYLGRTVKYPIEAQKNKVSGKVFLSFVVEKDGSLTDIKVDRKAGHGFDEEAVRVIEESPRWIPGVQDGKAVRVKYNIPISFSLTK